MTPNDFPRFQATMASLAEIFNREFSPQLADMYWEALKTLPIERVQAAANHAIRYTKHFPKPVEILEFSREVAIAQKAAPEVPDLAPLPRWVAAGNGLFLRYLEQRRVKDGFRGYINLPERRRKTLELQSWFAGLEGEADPEATEEKFKAAFDAAMAAIPDAVAA